LKTIIERNVPKEKFHIEFESLPSDEAPMMIIQPEFLRRMKDMAALGGGSPFGNNFPDTYNLVVNANSDTMLSILNNTDEAHQNNLVIQYFDLVRLSQNLLKGEELTGFIKRSIELIK
jgi:molecular chaperone HtpG